MEATLRLHLVHYFIKVGIISNIIFSHLDALQAAICLTPSIKVHELENQHAVVTHIGH